MDGWLNGEVDEWVDGCFNEEVEGMIPTFAAYHVIDAVLIAEQLGRMITRVIKEYPKMLMRNSRA